MGAGSDYEVIVDQEECVSAGKCVASTGFFLFDSDQIATIDPLAKKPDDETLLRIARACPSGAIRLRRDGADVEI